MKKIVLLCCSMSVMLCAASNVVSRTAVYCRNLDDRSDYGLDKTAECRRTTDKLVARMYAAGAANKSGAAKRIAIIKQGSHPAPENLQYLYAFTNDMSYACLAAASIVQIVGVTSNSMAIADHALSMNPAQKNDGYRLCEIIVQKANEDVATPECRRIAVETVNKHAPKIPGAETLASRMAIEPSASPSPVALKPAVSPEIDIPKDKQIKAAFLTASAPRRCGTEGIGAFNRAVALCDGDNCLISRIATEIATEHANRVPWAIGVLSKYGSKENIPFLLGFTNDVRYCERAAHALLCIDGVTEETVEIANRAVMRDPNDSGEKYAICSAISRLSSKDGEMSKSRSLAISTLKRYSRTIPVTSLWADEFLLSLDPSYETSEERREMLREVASRRVNDWQINYATNALKKIDVKLQVQKTNDVGKVER